MKIKLLRASSSIKEIEFAATFATDRKFSDSPLI